MPGVFIPQPRGVGIFDFDFSTLPLSTSGNAAALRAALGYFVIERPSVASVQVDSFSLVTIGIGPDDPRVGDIGLGRGLCLEVSRTNLCIQNHTALDHNAWTGVSGNSFCDGPDAAAGTGWRAIVLSGNVGPYQQTSGNAVGAGVTATASAWYRRAVADSANQLVIGYDTVNALVVAQVAAWQRVFVLHADTNADVAVLPSDGRDWSGSGGLAAGDRDGVQDLLQLEIGKFPTEAMVTSGMSTATRAGERLYHSAAASLFSGSRLGLYFKVIPKFSVGGSNDETTNPMLWYIDANNKTTVNKATGAITITIGGVAYTTPTGFTWARGDVVEIWCECGGAALATRVSARKNGGATTTLSSGAPPTQAALTVPSTIDLLCQGTTAQLSCWLQRITAYAAGLRPSWA